MKFINISFTCLVIFWMISINAFAAQHNESSFSASVSSEDVLFDGVPSDFDIKLFTARLNKELKTTLDDKGFPNNDEVYKYKLKADIDSVAHKLRPFHFKPQYIVNYRYKLIDNNNKELLRDKSTGINEDQLDLINEIVQNIIKNVQTTFKNL